MADKKKKAGLKNMSSYFKEVSAELKKVVYPTMSQVRTNTIVVLIMVFIVGVFIWALDWGFSKTVTAVISWGEKLEIESAPPYGNMLEYTPQNMTEEDLQNMMNNLPQDEFDGAMPEEGDFFNDENMPSNAAEQFPIGNEDDIVVEQIPDVEARKNTVEQPSTEDEQSNTIEQPSAESNETNAAENPEGNL